MARFCHVLQLLSMVLSVKNRILLYKCIVSILWTYLSPIIQFLYPLKTSQKHRFSGIFRGCENGTLGYKIG